MKIFSKKALVIAFITFTIPIEPKISIPKLPSRVSSLFSRAQEKTDYQEFNNIKKLEFSSEHGNIVVDTWKQPCVLIEMKKKGFDQFLKTTLLKCTVKNGTLQALIAADENVKKGTISVHIFVPENIITKLSTIHDAITIKNVSGVTELSSQTGAINITGGTHTVIAKTTTGNITVSRKKILSDHVLNIQSESGDITIAVPQEINCELQAHSESGKITSDLLVTLCPEAMQLSNETFKKLQHHVYGFIGQRIDENNPSTILLSSESGSIKILNRK